jgi:hypothetical protein
MPVCTKNSRSTGPTEVRNPNRAVPPSCYEPAASNVGSYTEDRTVVAIKFNWFRGLLYTFPRQYFAIFVSTEKGAFFPDG